MVAQDLAQLGLGRGLGGPAGLAGDPFAPAVEPECGGGDPALAGLVSVQSALSAAPAVGHDAAR
ncbi:hypothetical protein Ae406Ps2_0499 [Pseudonocardia sp. Ae406_Ps2]|nr:hypothetical protein Ae406Ps2_0499 [Pseudonocardia sp. Ae406_Ps2]OLM07708.1 hypothetical protein Ae331Ps2_5418c [Pseudonocardia sp. Ae331_Ps2]OLM22072.1 hypothetical protein Ae706Ps2_0504 [Pseudonocardia sp. Ae706_Ps2]